MFLFDDFVCGNIMLGDIGLEDFDDCRVWVVLCLVQVDGFVAVLFYGFDMYVGECGVMFLGG